ncbi:hypothetical protein E4U43_006782, partial [Claviceps pusilla]
LKSRGSGVESRIDTRPTPTTTTTRQPQNILPPNTPSWTKTPFSRPSHRRDRV